MAARGGEVRHVARWPIGYGELTLDRGQVFALQGLTNDEKLLRLGYIAELPKTAETYTCSTCGAEFIGVAERTSHGRDRHSVRSLTPEEEDRQAESRERMLQQVAPLNLDNTAAARR